MMHQLAVIAAILLVSIPAYAIPISVSQTTVTAPGGVPSFAGSDLNGTWLWPEEIAEIGLFSDPADSFGWIEPDPDSFQAAVDDLLLNLILNGAVGDADGSGFKAPRGPVNFAGRHPARTPYRSI